MAGPELVFKTVTTALRPARLAVLMDTTDSDWIATCTRIIEWTSQVWGGWYSCIIPTDGRRIAEPFWALLDRFDPDYVCHYRKTFADLEIERPDELERRFAQAVDEHLRKSPRSDPEEIRRALASQLRDVTVGRSTVERDLEADLLDRLNPFHYREQGGDTWHAIEQDVAARCGVSYPLTSSAALLGRLASPLTVHDLAVTVSPTSQLLLYSATGKLWPDFVEELRGKGQTAKTTPLQIQGVLETLEQAWESDPALNIRPKAFSLLNCALYSPIGRRASAEPAVVVVGDGCEDFCLYHGLSRMRDHVFWIPNSLADAYRERASQESRRLLFDGEEALISRLGRHLARGIPNKWAPPETVLTTHTASEDQLRAVQGLLEDVAKSCSLRKQHRPVRICRDASITEVLPYTNRLYELHNVERRYQEQFYQGISANLLNTPRPISFTSVPPSGHYWIAEIRFDGYHLPRRRELGMAILDQRNYSLNEIRVSSEGFAYLCPNIGYFGGDLESVLAKPRATLRDPEDLISRLASAAGYETRLSDKGRYHREAVSKFGSLNDMAQFFLAPPHRSFLDRYLDTSPSADGLGVFLNARRYLDLEAVSRCLGERTAAARLVDDLSALGILQRGFVFQCDACRNAAWYAVEDVGQAFSCTRCRRQQVYTRRHWKSPEEPRWYYRLHELVYQGYLHNMHVPALAMHVLKRRARDTFLYVPETEFRRDPSVGRPDLEVDWICIVDGELILGEATRAEELAATARETKSEVRKYKGLGDSLRARLALATLAESWGPRTRAAVDEVFGVGSPQVELLTAAELLAADPV